MKKIGVYPGTFDPITFGHIDVIRKSLKIVDKLIIAVSNDYSKNYIAKDYGYSPIYSSLETIKKEVTQILKNC